MKYKVRVFDKKRMKKSGLLKKPIGKSCIRSNQCIKNFFSHDHQYVKVPVKQ